MLSSSSCRYSEVVLLSFRFLLDLYYRSTLNNLKVLIVAMHMHHYVLLDEIPRHGERVTSTLEHLPVYAAHSANFNDWLVFSYSSAFRMPCFAFLSGVFGQKVDKISLLRVVCYTYGTKVMLRWFGVFINVLMLDHVRVIKTGELWYLICLFFWRMTLSPLFDMLKESSLKVRLATHIVVTVLCYGCYDSLGGSMTDMYSRTKLVPPSEYLGLGPFFAFGLLAPTREFTRLLLDKRLQLAGSLTIVALYCAAAWLPSHRSWLEANKVMLEAHWMAFDASRAFHPARLGEHALLLLYKAVATFSIMWLIAALTSSLCALAPDTGKLLLSGGARSMYSYTLHMKLIRLAADLCGAVYAVHDIGFGEWYLLAHASALFVVLLLTSRLTEALFHHLVMPFWILDLFRCFGLLAEDKPPSEKAVLGREDPRLKMACAAS
eukprot:TRINITY_DN38160_c0_g1_i2.p1 TRINITY_DN38160_c0_g1~~TRINITY_DN38160_c0_g1_i2.p1  ORF type:complete len:434 (-),score=22.92 TRINITY_DN38160_c0_g1_i2:102-1403(-)